LTLPLNGSIDRDSPAWTTNLLDSYISTIDAFSKYDNILGYNVGNEVVTAPNETDAAPMIKAAARDIKAYLSVHFCSCPRNVSESSLYLRTSQKSTALVGYAAIDGDASWVVPLANYLSCDTSNTAIDMFGLND
jgi:1,3-beta-glucanosyltransferase GAS1